MTFRTLIRRSLRFHARAHFGVVLGAAIGSAALIGALLVGDSVRESLRQKALDRLAGTYFALNSGDRFFNKDLSNRFSVDWMTRAVMSVSTVRWIGPNFPLSVETKLTEALLLPGTAQLPSGDARANQVQVFGIRGFTNFGSGFVLLNEALADQLHARPGDEVILRLQKGSRLSSEAAVGQSRDSAVSLRLRVPKVPSYAGDLDLANRGTPVMNVFVDYKELSDRVGLTNKANLLLVDAPAYRIQYPLSGLAKYWQKAHELFIRLLLRRPYQPPMKYVPSNIALQNLNNELQAKWELGDAALTVDYVPNWWGIELRSSRVFLDRSVESAAAVLGGKQTIRVLSYLGNLITADTNATPYSMVAAADPPFVPKDMLDDEIVVSQWLADDLHLKPGDSIDLSYFLPESGAKLLEATNRFRIHSIVPMEPPWNDRTLMPEFPGIENTESTRDWDAGFPLVYKIRPKDEQYWKEHKGTPKAFITYAAGRKLWGNRFGNVTAMRFPTPPAMSTGEYWFRFKEKLLSDLKPEDLGLRFEPVRERALAAVDQSQDFGQLFIGFSIFLVVAALLLMALLFQFGLEQRLYEIGLLLALGFSPRQVRRLFLLEGAGLALIGGILGTVGGLAYAAAMIWALNTLWSSAVANAALRFHATLPSIVIGLFAGFIVAIFTIWLTLRKQARQPARDLLAGDAATLTAAQSKSKSRGVWIGLASGSLAIATLGWAIAKGGHADAEVFFSSGALLLIAGLAFVSAWLARLARKTGAAHFTLTSLGVRGCGRRRTRSLATVALLACGSFLIASIGVFRLDANQEAATKTSGTGGFALIGESTLPIVHDLNTQSGRDFFGLDSREMEGVNVVSFRVHAGDEASCLNLNRAAQPRLLGVNPDRLTDRFTFSDAAKGYDRLKGWSLLKPTTPDEVLAIGDANSIQWALGKKLGDTIDYPDGRGNTFKVRLVASLANSVLQGSLLIDEAEFVNRFPDESGTRMFLIDAPANAVTNVSAALSRALQDQGLELTPATQRLNAFNAVQNTYLGTFQILGGLGLLLGSAGLGVVVLRNVLERRGELGLLVAVGFRRRSLNQLILGEHAALLGLGLGLGILCAAVAVLPAVLSPGTHLPYASLALTLGAVVLNGGVWAWLATRYALRGDLLGALRNE